MFTHDAPKKWYIASREYTLLEVGVQLMLARKCNNLTNVSSLIPHVRLSVHIPAMDEHIVEVTRCKFSHLSQQICDTSVSCIRSISYT